MSNRSRKEENLSAILLIVDLILFALIIFVILFAGGFLS